MVLHFYFTALDFFTEYFGLYAVPFLRLGLGLGLGFMCANNKQKYDGHIHLQQSPDHPNFGTWDCNGRV
jgi:hypothetical protein